MAMTECTGKGRIYKEKDEDYIFHVELGVYILYVYGISK